MYYIFIFQNLENVEKSEDIRKFKKYIKKSIEKKNILKHFIFIFFHNYFT